MGNYVKEETGEVEETKGFYHHQDPKTGHLTGGEYHIPGLDIEWEDCRKGGKSDGVKVEDVVLACIDRIRLRQYFKSQRNRDNALAVTHLEDAVLRLGAKIPKMKTELIYIQNEDDVSDDYGKDKS